MGNLGAEDLAGIWIVVRGGEKGSDGLKSRDTMFADSFNTFSAFYYGPGTRASGKK